MQGIKIYGMERTCTNYVRELIELNTDAKVYLKEFGNKHGYVDPESWMFSGNEHWREFYENNQLYFLICVKNPYHWLLSAKRYGEKDKNYIPFNPQRLLRRYNEMYLHWHLKLVEQRHQFFTDGKIVKYEDLLLDPVNTLFKKPFGCNTYLDTATVKHSDIFTEERRCYYLSPVRDAEIIAMVNIFVSDEFFLKYGYQRIER